MIARRGCLRGEHLATEIGVIVVTETATLAHCAGLTDPGAEEAFDPTCNQLAQHCNTFLERSERCGWHRVRKTIEARIRVRAHHLRSVQNIDGSLVNSGREACDEEEGRGVGRRDATDARDAQPVREDSRGRGEHHTGLRAQLGPEVALTHAEPRRRGRRESLERARRFRFRGIIRGTPLSRSKDGGPEHRL